ncbi:MAG: hypothetical protein U1F43_03620 [Myxococcota bacterium]
MTGGARLAALAIALGACGDDATSAPDTTTTSDDTDATIGEDADAAVGDVTTGDITTDASSAPDATTSDDASDATSADADVVPSTERIPDDVLPCDEPRYWPYALRSSERPLTVHYRTPAERNTAESVVGYLERSWLVEVDQLGFRAPLPDDGRCGDDADLDVFLWRNAPEVFTDVLGSNPATSWDDAPVFIVLDPAGEVGGQYLDSTASHEFNHACQAAYDWSEVTLAYEMTSTFIEDQVFDEDDNYQTILFDFQGNPDWSIDRDDGYETWYMYGAAMYLGYLRDRFYRGDPSFAAVMWEGSKSSAAENEPDYQDALDTMLGEFGKSFLDSVVEFQRWRWYVNERDDARHLEEAGAFPADALPAVAAHVDGDATTTTPLDPMMLGTSFVDVTSTRADLVVEVALDRSAGASEADVQWVVQALPGRTAGSDGELVDLSRGAGLVTLVDGRRTLVVTALPGSDASSDPDDRSDDRYKVKLRVKPSLAR